MGDRVGPGDPPVAGGLTWPLTKQNTGAALRKRESLPGPLRVGEPAKSFSEVKLRSLESLLRSRHSILG
jgi:hypothetical protein